MDEKRRSSGRSQTSPSLSRGRELESSLDSREQRERRIETIAK